MIPFAPIWWLFPAGTILLILLSLYLTRSGKMKQPFLRSAFVVLGALVGFSALLLPLFEQPVLEHIPLQMYAGVPLVVLGLIGRIYPALYLRRKRTTTTMDPVQKLVTTGPYSIVRHPQYTAGFLLLLGWYLLWGAVYGLYLLPLIGVLIYIQAKVEERYILEPKFGNQYRDYASRTGMLLWLGKRFLTSNTIEGDGDGEEIHSRFGQGSG
jgi:protein-S-isoprenylcysteine O-methyltransferase Ste14